MDDEQLQRLLKRGLPPEDLDTLADAELEAMLDGELAPAPTHSVLKPWFLAATAAAVVVLAFFLASLRRTDEGKPEPELVEGQSGVPATPNREREEPKPPSELPSPQPPSPVPPQPRELVVPPESEWVEVSPEFPKPMFVGTPVKAVRPNLESVLRPRLSFRAPAGSALLSLGAKVSSSDPAPIIGDLDMVVDGDKDGADGSYVELAPGKQWVQIDLGESHEIWAIVVWHFHKNARAYDDVIVVVSEDAGFESSTSTVYNNDYDNSSGMGEGSDPAWVETNHGRIIEGEGRRARYVRLYSNGNTANEMNHYVEVEIYGR